MLVEMYFYEPSLVSICRVNIDLDDNVARKQELVPSLTAGRTLDDKTITCVLDAFIVYILEAVSRPRIWAV